MSIKKGKTESDIRIFKDCLSTVGELCYPEDIGLLLTEIGVTDCSIFTVFNNRHDGVNINIRHH
jgi:hypothetical protein